ncbi:M1 family metallopeptidase [Pollutibacter soli]|uniref:M1 family metallopeptidase n=1 Tax=Pollutibacter soli TaxID=3034157 RepID=UPI0030134953
MLFQSNLKRHLLLNKFISRIYLIILCCSVSLTIQAKDIYPKNFDIDIQHYKFELLLSGQSNLIVGKATVNVLFKKSGITEFRLDLSSLIDTGKSKGKGMKIDSIIANNKKLDHQHIKDVILIRCDPSKADRQNSFIIFYRGVPATGLHIKPNKYGDTTFFSDNWPDLTRNWLPVIDHPYDKATCEFIVTAPERFSVVSNGIKLEESSVGKGFKKTHWKQSVPISSWLYVLGVAEFAVQYVDQFEGKSIETWVIRQARDSGFKVFAEPSKEVLAFYSDYVGPFAYEKLANIQSNSVSGGMEAASAILYAENSVSLENIKRWRDVIIHEIAHQWFGNAVTESDWDDVWLSEGFATYFTDLFIEHAYGHDVFSERMQQERKRVYMHHKELPEHSVIHNNLDDMSKVTSAQTYYKGAWILHMLRNDIGEPAFKQGIRNYYKKYFNSNSTTADFQLEMEQVSGKDLSGFFRQWLVQKGNLFLKGSWIYSKNTEQVTVTLQQTQSSGSYNVPVEIGLFYNGKLLPEIHKVILSDKSVNIFSFKVAEEPKIVDIDPRVVLLCNSEFSKK